MLRIAGNATVYQGNPRIPKIRVQSTARNGHILGIL
jgi:hypothetical protein